MKPFVVVALISIVTVLMLVQVPLDLQTHRLSRRATTYAAAAVAIVVVGDVLTGGAITSVVVSVMSVVLVVGAYWVVHRVSPQSLGWGDVLLVAPLTLAVAYVAVERVLWWQLVAAFTGAAHATWVRVRSGRNHVPFGPHLLIAAWLMLVLSV